MAKFLPERPRGRTKNVVSSLLNDDIAYMFCLNGHQHIDEISKKMCDIWNDSTLTKYEKQFQIENL